jgi:glucose-6-phosphate 1-dehydrogenase
VHARRATLTSRGVISLHSPLPEPCALVLFGGTGNLAQKRLLPALYQLVRMHRLPEGTAVVGFSMEDLTTDAYRAFARRAIEQAIHGALDDEVWRSLARRLEYVSGHFEDAASYVRLKATLERIDRTSETAGRRLFYLAIPASAFGMTLVRLHDLGLLTRNNEPRPWPRVVIEKPFGQGLASAQQLNALLAQFVFERQVFRVDHYLGKETVQNILVLRFGNSVLEPLFNRKFINHVQITAAESYGIEGRGRFYEETGVLRDVVQNHLLQVLSLCAVEPPVSFDADDIHSRKSDVFRALHRLTPQTVSTEVVAGQYRGYREEPGVSPSSRTPTFVALRLLIDNWRWQGVPFYLRAGKKLAATVTEVRIEFQPIPFCLFDEEDCGAIQPNALTLQIQPEEGLTLAFTTKVPGEHLSITGATMKYSQEERFHAGPTDAYERLMLACMRGDRTLFARRDNVELAWEFVTPILEAWEEGKLEPVIYEPGSQGPREADQLIARDGRMWRWL